MAHPLCQFDDTSRGPALAAAGRAGRAGPRAGPALGPGRVGNPCDPYDRLMPVMANVERAFCASPAWGVLARRAILPWALQDQQPAGRGLEIGSGAGAMAAQLLRAHPALRLTATDFDPAMVQAASERLGRFGDRATARQADAIALPFADGAFDVTFSFLMLHHVGDWEQALRELLRVLRPGGRLLAYDVLDTRPDRFVHRVTGSPGVRFLDTDALRALLASLPLSRAVLRPGAVAVRVSAWKR